MYRRTRRGWLWFVFCLVLSGAAGATGKAGPGLAVTVSVHNDAKISSETLTQAEAVSSRIFGQAGLEVHWVNCPLPKALLAGGSDVCAQSDFPGYLQMRILGRPRSLTPATFGISYLSENGIGCYSEVFFEPVTELHRRFDHSEAIVLGHVMTHEIAHLLLGTNSHSSLGIMSAHWQPEELARASKGRLLFTQAQSELMKSRLGAASPEYSVSIAGVAPTGK